MNFLRQSYIKDFQFEISCPSRGPSCNHASPIAPFVLFFSLLLLLILLHFALLQFCRLLLTTGLKLLLHREVQLCILWTLGDLLFHWLAAFPVDISVWEGVTCLVALVFPENPSSLKELIKCQGVKRVLYSYKIL